ncbi:bifunctional RNase H/acid phosphatase [Sphaerimonospora thailandensis]|uniref:Bifunctional RNase H/acid phosphatase n=1 Tax=Sphaerimonospora thailandensis TaxID=795644 RepID=A0A8J3R8J9_9ACTN|nr:bifunctional RNase H/acid phosphatase [Sphaerimonospora thailandensis]GIH69369.1 bifunctional RNase H/acid phosphatase [Sphaerimonospora thailandensis]
MTCVRFVVEADGGSRGNPGPAGFGAVVRDSAGRVLAEVAESIGTATNNVAEYRGLIAGLRALHDLGAEGEQVEVRMDSKLVIEQMAGRWKVKHEGLRPLAAEAAALAGSFRVTWRWIPREQNSHADRLANEAMDAAARGETWQAKTVSSEPAPGGPEVLSPSAEPPNVDAGPAPVKDLRRGPGWMPSPARTPTSLLLLRHGQTPLSIDKRFSGLGDPLLTPAGMAQAEAAAARLSREPYEIDVIVSSPLKRARQTAEAVAVRTGLTVEVDEDLRETDFGVWEGHTFAEVQQRWPDQLAAWLADPDVAPPDGESFAAAARRVDRARERIVKAYESRHVLVVSHVTPIKLLVRFALNAPPEALYRMHLDLACLSAIDYYADGPAVVRTLNDTAHLH